MVLDIEREVGYKRSTNVDLMERVYGKRSDPEAARGFRFFEGFISAGKGSLQRCGRSPLTCDSRVRWAPKGPQDSGAKGYLRRVSRGSRALEMIGFSPGQRQVVPVPVVGRVRAGEPILAVENVEGYITLDRNLLSSKMCFSSGLKGTA